MVISPRFDAHQFWYCAVVWLSAYCLIFILFYLLIYICTALILGSKIKISYSTASLSVPNTVGSLSPYVIHGETQNIPIPLLIQFFDGQFSGKLEKVGMSMEHYLKRIRRVPVIVLAHANTGNGQLWLAPILVWVCQCLYKHTIPILGKTFKMPISVLDGQYHYWHPFTQKVHLLPRPNTNNWRIHGWGLWVWSQYQ